MLHVVLPRLSVALELGRIAFGQGGFCLVCPSRIEEGPVRFDLEFQGEAPNLAGHGVVRWADPDKNMVGLEIVDLDEACREWAIDIILLHADSSYIPRAPLTTAPKVETAR